MTIPGDRKAISEMRRELRPDGRLLLLNHVRASSRLGRAVQRLLEPLVIKFDGDHLLRRQLGRSGKTTIRVRSS